MIVSGDRVQTQTRSNNVDSGRSGEVSNPGICSERTSVNTTLGAPRIPLSSPMISKRIVTCNKKKDNRRRVIFPFLPETPEVESPSSGSSSRYPDGSASQGTCGQNSDPVPGSPRLVCESFDFNNLCMPKMPFLPPPLRGEPRLLPRESTLSSHEESPCGPKKLVSFQESSSFFEEEPSDQSAKNVDGTVMFPPSILRSPSSRKVIVEKSSSVESDLPSLAGSSQSESCEELRRIFPNIARIESQSSVSESRRAVAFDPRIWIREFERTPEEHQATWYTSKELEQFKVAAVERIMAFSESELVPTGTGRAVAKRTPLLGKAFFSHKALGAENDIKNEALFRACLQNELRRILVVDSHDTFLRLFDKTLRPLLPHAEIVLASSAAIALAEAERGRFDLILVEERLKPLHQKTSTNSTASTNIKTQKITSGPVPTDQESCSGTALMKRLQAKHGRALYIGVSAKLREDLPRLQAVGDVCWSKPPPHMNAKLVRDLLHKLLVKRQRFQAVAELYSTTC